VPGSQVTLQEELRQKAMEDLAVNIACVFTSLFSWGN